MDISGQSAIVTGGGSGLGAATAEMLSRAGAQVTILDHDLAAAQGHAAAIGGRALQCDVSDGASIEAAFNSITAQGPVPRILVSCAGVAPAAKIVSSKGTMPLEDFARAVNVNLVGSFATLRALFERAAALDALDTGERRS